MRALSTLTSRKLPSADNLLLGSDAPLGFAAGDTNLMRYVGNHPTIATDPDGLEEKRVVPPTADKLKWDDFPVVAVPPKGGEAGAGVHVLPYPGGGGGSFNFEDKDGKVVGTWTFGKLTFKYVFDGKESYRVVDMTTPALLEHERLHLRMFEYMAQRYQEYLRMQTFMGTWDNTKEAIKAKNEYLDKQAELLKKFAEQMQQMYDHQTEHGVNAAQQEEWRKNWQAKIDALWKKKSPPPVIK